MIRIGTVVQFNEKHKWCGCLGIITKAKEYQKGNIRYMVGVPIPERGTAYIFVMQDDLAMEIIGDAVLMESEE